MPNENLLVDFTGKFTGTLQADLFNSNNFSPRNTLHDVFSKWAYFLQVIRHSENKNVMLFTQSENEIKVAVQ